MEGNKCAKKKILQIPYLVVQLIVTHVNKLINEHVNSKITGRKIHFFLFWLCLSVFFFAMP